MSAATRPLLSVTRDRAGTIRMFYLRYADAPVARTLSITPDEGIAMDVDAGGAVIGIELLSPGTSEIEKLERLARERGLSLDGLDRSIFAA